MTKPSEKKIIKSQKSGIKKSKSKSKEKKENVYKRNNSKSKMYAIIKHRQNAKLPYGCVWNGKGKRFAVRVQPTKVKIKDGKCVNCTLENRKSKYCISPASNKGLHRPDNNLN